MQSFTDLPLELATNILSYIVSDIIIDVDTERYRELCNVSVLFWQSLRGARAQIQLVHTGFLTGQLHAAPDEDKEAILTRAMSNAWFKHRIDIFFTEDIDIFGNWHESVLYHKLFCMWLKGMQRKWSVSAKSALNDIINETIDEVEYAWTHNSDSCVTMVQLPGRKAFFTGAFYVSEIVSRLVMFKDACGIDGKRLNRVFVLFKEPFDSEKNVTPEMIDCFLKIQSKYT